MLRLFIMLIILIGCWSCHNHTQELIEPNVLFILADDPGEKKDLANPQRERAAKMEQELLDYLLSIGANPSELDEQYDPLKKKEVTVFRRGPLLGRLRKQRLQFLDPDFQPNEIWWDSQLITKD